MPFLVEVGDDLGTAQNAQTEVHTLSPPLYAEVFAAGVPLYPLGISCVWLGLDRRFSDKRNTRNSKVLPGARAASVHV